MRVLVNLGKAVHSHPSMSAQLRTTATWTLLVLLAALSASAQERFISRDLNFSVATPGGWSWSRLSEGAGVWLVAAGDGERFTVTVSPPGKTVIDEAWILDMMRAVQKDASQHAERVEQLHFTRRTAPIYPSFVYGYDRVTRDGRRTHVDGYVAAAGRVYALQYASAARAAGDRFRAFIDSFQIADKFESQRAARSSGGADTLKSFASAMAAPLGRAVAPNTETIGH
jgi:hypothetical protein